MPRFFPTRQQWRNWNLPSKATYAGVWIGLVGIVIAVVVALVPEGPVPPDIRALETEVVENLTIFREKIIVADHVYRQMLLAEESAETRPPWLLPPSPYEDLGPRLLRDLPEFRFHYLRTTGDPRISKDEPFKTYNQIFKLFEMVEDNERRRILVMNSIWESYQDMGATSVFGIPAYRNLFQQLLARDYVVSWGVIVGLAQSVGVNPELTLPRNLQITRDVEEHQGGGGSQRRLDMGPNQASGADALRAPLTRPHR